MKNKTLFICQECGYESQKWLGKCPQCNNWNTFVEEMQIAKPAKSGVLKEHSMPMPINSVLYQNETRIKTGMAELDLVLGGGAVLGSLVLVGGEPGIGKSTLLLQICSMLVKHGTVLYVSGEESQVQIKMRADRLLVTSENLFVVGETNIDQIEQSINHLKPRVVIIDSVQTMYSEDLSGVPGSVGQVRESTLRLMRIAKEKGITIFIVGHVTKEGSIAGPRVLEHMVDCVLYFEGDRHQSYRILRAVKNRFGSTNEIGVFEMSDKGLIEVQNPSAMLISERPCKSPGSAVVCTVEGTRPLLAEVQALVTPTGFGIPRRMAAGIDYNRMSLIIAVLEKRIGLSLQNQDVYLNVVGGVKLDETAVDLSIAAAIVSSFRNIDIDEKMVMIGEVGLTGELRSISHSLKRINEASKMGFDKIIIPSENEKALKGDKINAKIIGVKTVKEAMEYIK
jgi:DNA repair protein RadA/Sms